MSDRPRRVLDRALERRAEREREPGYRTRVLWVTMLGVAATSYPITLLSAAIPRISSDLETTDSVTAWVVTAPLLAYAVLTPVAGKLGDLYGHRRIFLASFALTAIASALTTFAWDIGSLIALRTFSQGAASAAGPSSMAIIISAFPPDQRARPLGVWAGVLAASPAIGVLVGGPLVDLVGWRSLFVIQAVIAALAALLALDTLPETARKTRVRFDVGGAATLSVGLGAALLAINRGPIIGFDRPVVVTGLLVGAIGLAAFAAVERRAESALLPLEFFGRGQFTLPILTQLTMQSAYMGTLVTAPIFLDRVFDLGTTAIGLAITPRPLSFAVAAALAGRLEETIGRRVVLFTGVALLTVGMVAIGAAIVAENLALVIGAIVVIGCGSGAVRPSIAAAVAGSVDETDVGVASGSLNMVSQVGAAIGISAFTGFIGDSDSTRVFLAVHLVAACLASVGFITGARFTHDDARPVRAGVSS